MGNGRGAPRTAAPPHPFILENCVNNENMTSKDSTVILCAMPKWLSFMNSTAISAFIIRYIGSGRGPVDSACDFKRCVI